jgi:hypothetical protein
MAASGELTGRLDELIALFNRRSLDLPDGLFDRLTQFCLNGVPFEAMLGRAPTDPLVLMIARGPAGYRFVIKAVQHALPDARVERGHIEPPEASDQTVPLWLSGRLRGTDEPLETVLRIALTFSERGSVARADLAIEPSTLARLREARLRP